MNNLEIKNLLELSQSIQENSQKNSTILENFQEKIQENLLLKEKIISLESELKISKEISSLQQVEFTFIKSEMESEINFLKNQLNNNENENEEIKDIKYYKNIINKLKFKNKELKNFKNKEIIFEKENEILKLKLNSQENIINDFKNKNILFEKQKNLIEFIKYEKEELIKILNLENNSIDSNWSNIHQKVYSLIQSQNLNESLKKQIEILKNKFSNSLENFNKNDKYINKIYENSQDNQQNLLDLKYKFDISNLLNFNYLNILRIIDNIYNSIIPNPITQIRSIILSFIFINRFLKFKKNNIIPNISALIYFKSRNNLSINFQINYIKNYFLTLTEELIKFKKELINNNLNNK